MKKVKKVRLNDAQYHMFTDNYDEITQEQNITNEQNKYIHQETNNKPDFINHSYLNTMSNDELNEHIQKCLEMSSENKITPKNAFALQLIDCMNILLSKKDFSTMACTLDAGAKIYSNRVDALHHQVIKLADEVILNQRKLVSGNSKEENNQVDDKMERHLRKGKKRIVIGSPKSLRKKLKGKDPRDKFMKVNGQPGAIITAAKIKSEDLSLTLENNIQLWKNLQQIEPLKASGKVTLPDCKIYRNEDKLFYTSQTYSNETNIDLAMKFQSQTSTMDGLISSADQCADIDSKSETNSLNEVHVISTAIKKINNDEDKGIAEKSSSRFEAMKLIFHQSSEYHYLDMKKSYFWAGPEYWKRTKAIGKADKSKTAIRKKKQHREIIYNYAKKYNKKVTKTSTVLTKRTIAGWKRKKLTIPRDLKFDIQILLDLFNISVINNEKGNAQDSNKSFQTCTIINNLQDVTNNNHQERFSQNSLLSNFHDTLYESEMDISGYSEPTNTINPASDDKGAIKRSGIVPEHNKKNNLGKAIKVEVGITGNPPFNEPLLGPMPKLVRFKPIKYNSRPIRIDMHHLKNTMWDIIKKGMQDDAKEKNIWSDCSGPEAEFGNILKQLSKQLEEKTAEHLTPPIALMALLTLANEYQLELVNNHSGDIVVRPEDYSLIA